MQQLASKNRRGQCKATVTVISRFLCTAQCHSIIYPVGGFGFCSHV